MAFLSLAVQARNRRGPQEAFLQCNMSSCGLNVERPALSSIWMLGAIDFVLSQKIEKCSNPDYAKQKGVTRTTRLVRAVTKNKKERQKQERQK
eukprot:6238906-Amphidinium_carterae.1